MIIKQLENKKIVWFKDTNEYIVIEPLVAEILLLLHHKTDKQEIITKIFDQINIPYKETENLVTDIASLLKDQTYIKQELVPVFKPQYFEYEKYYKINDVFFKVNYLSEFEYSLVHPKFAHLEITTDLNNTHHFEVYSNNKFISFSIDANIIGTWSLSDVHFFQGKFSMKIVEHMHQKKEADWLGVFHASAISNGTSSMLFLGDSGNGKSTSLALLQANDFTCLADDFVPIDAKKQHIYSFPSAISIKKNSLKTLLPIYPELQNSAEYNFKKLNKIVRYLIPNNSNNYQHFPCKALVFIKFKKDSDLLVSKISNLDAFQQLVPDSWLSPIPENVIKFLDWFEKLTCYQLTYSNNSKMIETVHKIFNDDL